MAKGKILKIYLSFGLNWVNSQVRVGENDEPRNSSIHLFPLIRGQVAGAASFSKEDQTSLSPATLSSSFGVIPWHPPGEMLPEPPHLAPLNVKEQQLD